MISNLAYTLEVAEETAALYARVQRVIPPIEWSMHAPYIAAINRLKKQKNAVILAHNYQTPEIYHCVADIVGDSLKLARDAKTIDADIIILCGVHFMAETAKIVNPSKTVLVPDLAAGCSLSESITAADVRLLRQQYPNIPIVTYVNTSADVKAESDICCTSGNILKVINSLDSETVLCIPDQYLADYAASQTDKKILKWQGSCMVHELFTAEEIRAYRRANKGVTVLAHPECPSDVLAEADYVGSTAGMSEYVRTKQPAKVVMITECSMSDNVAVENPNVEFIRPCNLCPHMKRNSLAKILHVLETGENQITVPEDVRIRALAAIDRMLAVS